MERKGITILDNEPYLRKVSIETNLNDSSLKDEIEDLKEFCVSNNLFALAAVQIGIPKRIIFLRVTNPNISLDNEEYNEERVLINPKIISRKGHTKFWEGCASCLDNLGLVSRPYQIEVEYQDINGNNQREKFIGFESTVLSHEYDHLNGILHIDISEEIIQKTREERKIFRDEHPYEVISEDCDFEKLLVKTRKQ